MITVQSMHKDTGNTKEKHFRLQLGIMCYM